MKTESDSQAFDEREKKLAYVVIPLLIIGLVVTWFMVNSPRVSELNQMLAANTELAAYPYSFRVLSLDGDTAVMTSPRSAQSSVLQALKIIKPDMSVADPNSAPVIAAQKELAELQFKAKDLVLAQPDINDVRWELDKNWLLANGAVVLQ